MSDTSTMMRPTALPIDPRIQERLLAVRREEGRRRMRWVVGAVGAAFVILLGLGITRSPLFAVHHVRVTGGVHTSEADVMKVTGLGHHPLMLDLNTSLLSRNLEALPWVAQARVHRHWPSTVTIQVSERTPVALVAAGPGQLALVDGGGRVLATGPAAAPSPPAAPAGAASAGAASASGGRVPAGRAAPPTTVAPGPPPLPRWIPGQLGAALPLIQGVPAAGQPGSSVAGPGIHDALVLAASLPSALGPDQSAQVSAIVGGDGNLRLTTLPGWTVSFGSADQLAAKLLALRTLLERVNLKDIATIDVRVPDAPILTRLGTPSTVSTIPRG
jgi:cell division septal protein FtsQ